MDRLATSQTDRPPVSVVIPLYNKGALVERTIRSVLAQSVQDFEIIVVNDGSTDDGPDVVNAIGDPRLRLVHQENAGVSAARNRGIEEAKSDLVAFLDADDEWMPEFLSTIQRLQRQYPQCDVFATGYIFRYDDGQERKPGIRVAPSGKWEGVIDDYFDLAGQGDPPLCSSAVAVVRGGIMDIGGFPVGVPSGEDLLTWARLAARHQIAYAAEPQCVFQLGSYDDRAVLRRSPQVNDVVGRELKALRGLPMVRWRSLKRYLALWYKMQASCFLRCADTREARRHTLKAMKYRPFAWKLYAYLLLSTLPYGIGKRILSGSLA